MPNKLNWIPFYFDDFIGDEKVMAMSDEAVGVYIKLLCAACKSEDGTLPDDDKALIRLARTNGRTWARVRDHVRCVFVACPVRVGRVFNARLQIELEKARQMKHANRENGIRGAEKRWRGYGEANGEAMARPMATPMANTRQDKTGHIYPPTPQWGGTGAPPVDQDGVPKTPVKKEKPVFIPPTIDEIEAEMKLRGFVSPRYWAEKFHAHYESKGWKVGREKMKDWRAAVRGTWDSNRYTPEPRPHGNGTHHNGQRRAGPTERTAEQLEEAYQRTIAAL